MMALSINNAFGISEEQAIEQNNELQLAEETLVSNTDKQISPAGVSDWLTEIQAIVDGLTDNEITRGEISLKMQGTQKRIDELYLQLAEVQEKHACLEEEMKGKEDEYLTMKIRLKELSDN